MDGTRHAQLRARFRERASCLTLMLLRLKAQVLVTFRRNHEGSTLFLCWEASTATMGAQMRTPTITLLGLAALVLALVFSISPKMSTTANEAWTVSGIDTVALTKKANVLPEQSFPSH
jgi:hypothetical protein